MDAILPGLEATESLHPLLVHFPVALWPAALICLAVAYLRAKDDLFRFGTWLLHGGVAAGLAAAITGWLAADALGHDHTGHDLVHDHRNFMIAALGLAAAAAGAAHWTNKEKHRHRRWLPVGLLLVACLLSVLGADRGGLLVYGHGIGIRKGQAATSGHGAATRYARGAHEH